MKKSTCVMLVVAAMMLLQSVTFAQPVLLDPTDGLYQVRIVNLTHNTLSFSFSNDQNPPSFMKVYGGTLTNSDKNNYLARMQDSKQTVMDQIPITLGTAGQSMNNGVVNKNAKPFMWEGCINLFPLITASNERTDYVTYSGHFPQTLRMTINTPTSPQSPLNNAIVDFAYCYNVKQTINWNNVVDFGVNCIKNAGSLAVSIGAAADGDADPKAIFDAGMDTIKTVAGAFQTSPLSASLYTETLSPQTTQSVNYFTTDTIQNYLAVGAGFLQSASNGTYGGNDAGAANSQNQVCTIASPQLATLQITATANGTQSTRYFTFPAYYIYIKNVEAPVPTGNVTGVNKASIVIMDGWIYNVLANEYAAQQNPKQYPAFSGLSTAQQSGLSLFQLMYYLGSDNNTSTPNNNVKNSTMINTPIYNNTNNTPTTVAGTVTINSVNLLATAYSN